jgi:hypothetical protein
VADVRVPSKFLLRPVEKGHEPNASGIHVGSCPLEPSYTVSYTCVIVTFGRVANGTGRLEGTCRNENGKGCRMEKNLFPSDFQPHFPVFTSDVRGMEVGRIQTNMPLHFHFTF